MSTGVAVLVYFGSYRAKDKEIIKNSIYVPLMVVNKNLDRSEPLTIDLKDIVPSNKGNAWILNGPSVDATNEINHNNVSVQHEEFDISGNSFAFIFEPHSLTAIEITRKEN